MDLGNKFVEEPKLVRALTQVEREAFARVLSVLEELLPGEGWRIEGVRYVFSAQEPVTRGMRVNGVAIEGLPLTYKLDNPK